jgi:hypothetical protein
MMSLRSAAKMQIPAGWHRQGSAEKMTGGARFQQDLLND